jgi:DNA-binding response OmpR family regulator
MPRFRRRILCIEEDEDCCEMITLSLEMAGYEVISVHTAAAALNKTLTGGFDLLLLDNHLPDGAGLELCKQIREFNHHTPIIFYSGEVSPRQVEDAIRAGAQAYLAKPVFPEKLEQAIGQLLK